jgi:lysophospholipase L1-like esterase
MTTILVFGDSIACGFWDSEGGWVARLRKYLDKRNLSEDGSYYVVYNLGISGDTTRELLKRFDAEVKARVNEIESPKDLIIIFAIGINDAGMLNSKDMVPPLEFKRSLEKLLDKARSLTSNVVFIGSTPVDETKTHPVAWSEGFHYDNASIARDNKIIEAVCAEDRVMFLGLARPFGPGYSSLLQDGVHPNSDGHKLIYQTVKSFLVKKKLIK